MFIVPAVLVYRYLFPQLSFANCVFSYFMVDNCLILLILFSRTLSEIICDVFSLSLNLVMIIVYLVLSAAFLLFYRLCLCRYIRGALGGFRGADMRLLAVFAVLAYFGTLFVVDVWAPWEKLTYKMVHLCRRAGSRVRLRYGAPDRQRANAHPASGEKSGI